MVEFSITWNKGGFVPDNWRFVYELVRRFDIKTVLEYGVGLTTELLNVVGLKVHSMETQSIFYDLYRQKFDVELCNYDEGYPELNRTFDLGFIDGPGEAERHDRSKSVIHAKKYCNFIYLHDYNLNQFEHLNNDIKWEQLGTYSERQDHFFIKRVV